MLKGMNSVIRLTNNHIEYEPEWEKSYFFLSRLQKPLSLLIEWCSIEKRLFNETIKILLDSLVEFEKDDPEEFDIINLENECYEILTYDVASKEVSLHAHFTRFVACVLAQATKFELEPDLTKEIITLLVEPSMRAYVLYVQANIGIWKKNGTSLLNQASHT